MRRFSPPLRPALVLAAALGPLALATLGGCGPSTQDRAAAQANEDEQKLLQEKIQKGFTKTPVTRRR